MGTRCANHVTPLYPQKLALTSPTGGGRSVGMVRSRTKVTESSPVYLTHGALPAQYMWSNTHFCTCGKICTKYADVIRHRVKFSRSSDRDLCTMTLNYVSVRNKISLYGTGPFSYACVMEFC